ncbi:uncharacterized protein LOC124358984 [Homalodisca vitripennis]|uniref:uncharacterized protein LOC124358984 n=1 Tax=Homalodisca vitripennis TaxID=197043 RepID=UPI001EEB7483|nr:uncharacterized protein LOC124358984 [Homalodisca vitripennis]
MKLFQNLCVVFLLVAAAVVSARQDQQSSKAEDQEGASDKVTSILVHPGPNGPRHVIMSDDHQVLSTEGFASRAVDNDFHLPSGNFPLRGDSVDFHHTVPPPLHHATYGPARPVAVRTRGHGQLYHHRFGVRSKIPHLKAAKEDVKGLDAVYKYSTYIKHDDETNKEAAGEDDVSYDSKEQDKPDYSVTVPERDTYERTPQHEGLSAYRNRHEEEELKYRESMGDLDDDYNKNSDYSYEKKARPLPYSKLYFTKQHRYVPNNGNEKKYYTPSVNYNRYNNFEDQPHYDKPSGFDDMNGGKVVPILAKFYKQPLPVIHSQLPADNSGLYLQFFQPVPVRAAYDRGEVSDNYFEQYPEEKSSPKSHFHSSESEWTPINAPDGAVPAKSYDIPAPDLSLGKIVTSKVFRRGSDTPAVVVGKSKQTMTSNHHIQGNSEGVVSAVVRVKQ